MDTEVTQPIVDAVQAKVVSGLSYAGGATSVLSALTMTDIGILFGIVTAVLTFALNVWFQMDRRVREIKEHEARMQDLEE